MSSIKQSSLIVKNTLFLLISKIGSGVLSLILIAIIARKLGVEQFGLYTLALTIGGIFAVTVDFGFRYLTTYEIAKDNTKIGKYLVNGLVTKFLIAVPCFIILFLLVRHYYPSYAKYVILLACIVILFRSFFEFIFAFFDGFEKMFYTASLSFIYGALIFLVTTCLIFSKFMKISQLFYGQIVVGMVAFLLTLWIFNKNFVPKISAIDFSFIWGFLKKSVPFGLFFFAGIIYSNIDTVMLSIIKNTKAVGYYQSAIKIIIVLELIPSLFSNALYPTLSKNIVNSIEDAKLILERGMRYTLSFAIPIAVGIGILSSQMIILMYGSEYTPAILILQIFMFVLPIRYCSYVLGISLFATNNQNLRTISATIACLANIILNLILIPKYNYMGAVLASVFKTLILGGFYYIFLSKKFYRIKIEKLLLPPLISSLIMALIIYPLRGYSIFIIIPIAIIIYLLFLLLLRGIKREDFVVIKGIFLTGEKT